MKLVIFFNISNLDDSPFIVIKEIIIPLSLATIANSS